MTIASKKKIAWGMMSAGFGAFLLFIMAWVMKGDLPSAREWFVYLWPAGGLAIGTFSLYWSRALYRAEPPVPPAAWTLQLTDLLMATVFAGACGAIASAQDNDARNLAALFSLTGLALYLQGALAASLEGAFGAARRFLFVIIHCILSLGYIGVMTLGLCATIASFLTQAGPDLERGLDMIRQILWESSRDSLLYVFRMCVYALPVGLVLMAVWRRVYRTA